MVILRSPPLSHGRGGPWKHMRARSGYSISQVVRNVSLRTSSELGPPVGISNYLAQQIMQIMQIMRIPQIKSTDNHPTFCLQILRFFSVWIIYPRQQYFPHTHNSQLL